MDAETLKKMWEESGYNSSDFKNALNEAIPAKDLNFSSSSLDGSLTVYKIKKTLIMIGCAGYDIFELK